MTSAARLLPLDHSEATIVANTTVKHLIACRLIAGHCPGAVESLFKE
jgi:hypothetical protein